MSPYRYPDLDIFLQVCKYIDGTNHVSRVAQLADCDISLTRQAISHLLYVLPVVSL